MRTLILSEKGGVGKSFVSANVIASAMYVATKKKVKLGEVDASNFTTEFYSKSNIVDGETIQIQLDARKVRDDEFMAFLEGDSTVEDTVDEKNIYAEVENAVNTIIKNGYQVVDVGANATVVFRDTLIRKELLKYFQYIFLVSSPNVNEIAMAVKNYEILRENHYLQDRIFFIVNKYTDAIRSKLEKFDYINEDNLIKIREMGEYNTRIMSARVTIMDVINTYKEEDLRKELDKAIREMKTDEIEKISSRIDLLNKAKLFYYNNDFKKLVNLFKGGAK